MRFKTVLLSIIIIMNSSIASAQTNVDVQQNGKITSTGAWIPENLEELEHLNIMGPFVRLKDGSIVTVEGSRREMGTKSLISKDEGKTWEEYPIFDDPDNFAIRPERALIRTRSGIVILAFTNNKEKSDFNWDEEILDVPDAVLPTCVVRSLDGGKTWEDPQKLHNAWTGAVRDMIQTREGNVIFTSMMMRHNPGHHATATYTTKDEGKTWIRSNVIDLGGVGHHSRVIEATIEQLRDGRIWMLMRTALIGGGSWEAYSDNEGLTWKNFGPTEIKATSAPGLLKRLESGRLVLIFNHLCSEGEDNKEYSLKEGNGQSSEVESTRQRGEISIMLSSDDGKIWTDPVVIAKAVEEMRDDKGFYKGMEITYLMPSSRNLENSGQHL